MPPAGFELREPPGAATWCDFQGVLPGAAATFAVAVGVAAGVVRRRSVPAMVTPIGAFVAVRLGIAWRLQPRFASPAMLDGPSSADSPLAGTGAWILSERTVDSAGVVLGVGGSLNVTTLVGRCPALDAARPRGLPDAAAVEACLQDLDVRSLVEYHPGARFWTFQLLEAGVLVVLAAAALALAALLLPRRAAYGRSVHSLRRKA